MGYYTLKGYALQMPVQTLSCVSFDEVGTASGLPSIIVPHSKLELPSIRIPGLHRFSEVPFLRLFEACLTLLFPSGSLEAGYSR